MRFILRVFKHFDEQQVPACFLTTHAKDKSYTYSFNAPANVHKDWNYFKHNQSVQGFRIFFTYFSPFTISGMFSIISHLESRHGLNRVSMYGCNRMMKYFPSLRHCFGLKFMRLSAGSFEPNESDYVGLTSDSQMKEFLDKRPKLSTQPTFPNTLRSFFQGQDLNAARDSIHESTSSTPYYEDDAVRIYAIKLTSKLSENSNNGRFCYHVTEKNAEKLSINKEKFEAEIPKQFRRQLINNGTLEIDGRMYSLSDYRSTEGSAHFLLLDINSLEDLNAFLNSEYYTNKPKESTTSATTTSLFSKINFVVHLTPKNILETKEYVAFMNSLTSSKQLITASGYYSKSEYNQGQIPLFTFLNFNAALSTCFPTIQPQMNANYFMAWSKGKDQKNTPIENAPFYDSNKIWLSRLTEQIHIKNDEVISILVPPQSNSMHHTLKQSVLKSHHQLCERFKAIAMQQAHDYKQKSSERYFPEIIPLGTSSSQSTALRNESGYLIRTTPESSLLFDCGPSTFYQISKQFSQTGGATNTIYGNLKQEMMKIKMIVISHHHTDHHFGIVDFLAQRKQYLSDASLATTTENAIGRQIAPILVVLPHTILAYLDSLNKQLGEELNAVFISHDVVSTFQTQKGVNPNNNNAKSFQGLFNKDQDDSDEMGLDYTIFEEKSQQNQQLIGGSTDNGTEQSLQKVQLNLFKKRLEEIGISKLVLFPILHCHGSKSILIELFNKKRIAYSGDGRPNIKFASFMNNVDFLIHECTFTSEYSVQAKIKNHSFFDEVVRLAMDVQAKCLILSHFSTNNTVSLISKQIQNHTYNFQNTQKQRQDYLNQNTIIASDHLVIHPQILQDLPLASRIIVKISAEQ